jgi:hypothetical protein
MKREGKGLCGSGSELVLSEAEGARTVALSRLPLTWAAADIPRTPGSIASSRALLGKTRSHINICT